MSQSQQESPLISVIALFYQCKDYVRRCVESILSQEGVNLELIAIDDCSTDGTSEILSEYAAQDPRMRLIRHEKNQGIGASRNDGLKAVRGECFIFVDGDDALEARALERLLPGFLDGADLVLGGYVNVTPRGDVVGYGDNPGYCYRSKTEIDAHFDSLELGVCHNRLFRASLKYAPFRSLMMGEDAMWNQDNYPNLNYMMAIPDVTYRYTIRGDSASTALANVDHWTEYFCCAVRDAGARGGVWKGRALRMTMTFALPRLYKNPVSWKLRRRFIRAARESGILPASHPCGGGKVAVVISKLSGAPEWVRGVFSLLYRSARRMTRWVKGGHGRK